MMCEPLLETQNLTRRFGNTLAVQDVSLRITAGAVTGLIGPNGAGKTTLLHLIAGLLEPCSGQARFLDNDVRRLSASAAGELVAVGDSAEPPRGMKIGELVELQAGASARFARLSAATWLQEQELEPTRRFGTLSKGQRRWVLSVLGLAARPRLLLMDEPAVGLDIAARRRLYELVRETADDHGASIVISSHILTDLQRVVDDVALLVNGRLILRESLEVLRDEIREVEIPRHVDSPTLPNDVDVLARDSKDDVERIWVRGLDIDARLAVLGETATVRTVNLESLYLAISSRHNTSLEGKMHSVAELA